MTALPIPRFAALATLASLSGTPLLAQLPDPNPNPGNPIVETLRAADPDVHVWDGVVWMYTSQDQPKLPGENSGYSGMDGYHVFSSTDMVNWTDHGEILHSDDVPWGIETGGWMFAPGAARKRIDGAWKYFLYFPHKDTGGTFRVGVATADAPQGPFTAEPSYIAGTQGYDPMCLIDDDGQAYLYWGYKRVAKLTDDMLALDGPWRSVDMGASNFFEGTWVYKHAGKYYYTYTGNDPNKFGHYSIGDSPLGPFVYQGRINAEETPGAQDHHSIIEFQGQWYYFYHVGDFTNADGEPGAGNRRNACVDYLYYNEDGTIQPVVFTDEGVGPVADANLLIDSSFTAPAFATIGSWAYSDRDADAGWVAGESWNLDTTAQHAWADSFRSQGLVQIVTDNRATRGARELSFRLRHVGSGNLLRVHLFGVQDSEYTNLGSTDYGVNTWDERGPRVGQTEIGKTLAPVWSADLSTSFDWRTETVSVDFGSSGYDTIALLFHARNVDANGGEALWLDDVTLGTDADTDPEEDTLLVLEAESFDAESHPSDTNFIRVIDETSARAGQKVGFIRNNTWIRFDGVDLSSVNAARVRVASNASGGTLELREGSASGALLGSFPVTNTGGWNSWTTLTGDLTNGTGVNELYLRFTGGGGYLFDLDWLELEGTSDSGLDDDVGVDIPAVAFDAESHPSNANIIREMGNKVGFIQENSWLRFEDFEFGTGVDTCTILASSQGAGGDVELRLGSPTGTLIGTVTIGVNGNWNEADPYSTSTIANESNDDLYLVFKKNASSGASSFLFDVFEFRFD